MSTIKVRHAIAITLAALVIGSGCAWFVTRTILDREFRSLSLAHELEISGVCANGLQLKGAQRDDTLVMLLEQRLDSGVVRATQLVDEGAHLYRAPNLTDSVRRAADYYASKNYADRKLSAETLLARLQNER